MCDEFVRSHFCILCMDIGQHSLTTVITPTNGGRPLWWWVGPACRGRDDYQPLRSSYVSDTVLFSHD